MIFRMIKGKSAFVTTPEWSLIFLNFGFWRNNDPLIHNKEKLFSASCSCVSAELSGRSMWLTEMKTSVPTQSCWLSLLLRRCISRANWSAYFVEPCIFGNGEVSHHWQQRNTHSRMCVCIWECCHKCTFPFDACIPGNKTRAGPRCIQGLRSSNAVREA